MTEFNHPEQAIKQFRFRLFLAGLFVVLLFLVLVARLLWLQVISYDKYQSKAEDNRITIVPLVPNRIPPLMVWTPAPGAKIVTLRPVPISSALMPSTRNRLGLVIPVPVRPDESATSTLPRENKAWLALPRSGELNSSKIASVNVPVGATATLPSALAASGWNVGMSPRIRGLCPLRSSPGNCPTPVIPG